MKKMMLSILTIAMLASLTACGNNSSEEEAVTTPAIKVYNEQLTTTTTVTEDPTTEVPEKPIVPKLDKQNLSDEVDISVMSLNGYEVDIDNISLETFLAATQLHEATGVTSIDTSLLYFYSGMYSGSEGGTQVSVEVVNADGEVVGTDTIDEYEFSELTVKGVHCSSFWIQEDFSPSYYGGIYSGMPKDIFVALMGEGEVIGDKRVYQNTTHTMVVEIEAELDENGESVFVVDDITILVN